MTGVSVRMPSRRFTLTRDADPSGVSGVGHVADGVRFPDGTCVLRWAVGFRSTGIYDDLAQLEQIHGHAGLTRVEWLDCP